MSQHLAVEITRNVAQPSRKLASYRVEITPTSAPVSSLRFGNVVYNNRERASAVVANASEVVPLLRRLGITTPMRLQTPEDGRGDNYAVMTAGRV